MTRRASMTLVGALGLTLITTSAMASDDTTSLEFPPALNFSADRPGYGDATQTAPPMHLILEAGTTLSIQEDRLDLELPQALLRFGLTPWLELRLGLPGLNLPVEAEDVPRGSAGGVGVKVAFAPHERFAFSVVSTFGLPVSEWSDGQALLSWRVGLNLGLSLSDTFALGATVVTGIRQDLDVGEAVDWSLGGAFGVSGAFDDTGLYLETVASIDESEALQVALGLGLTQMLLEGFQLDLSFSYDLPGYGSATQVGLGLVTLF